MKSHIACAETLDKTISCWYFQVVWRIWQKGKVGGNYILTSGKRVGKVFYILIIPDMRGGVNFREKVEVICERSLNVKYFEFLNYRFYNAHGKEVATLKFSTEKLS